MATSATYAFQGFDARADEVRARPAPPKGGPVLIYDCIAPVQGTTLLHLLLARWAKADLSDDE